MLSRFSILVPSRRRFRTFGICAAFGLILGPAVPQASPQPNPEYAPVKKPDGPVVLTVHSRSESGAPLPVRVSIAGLGGESYASPDTTVHKYDAYTGHSYYYSNGTAEALVPKGPIRVLLSHGPEYEAVDDTVLVGNRTIVTYTLRRLFSPAAHGWRGGDTHTHIAHGGVGDVFDVSREEFALIARCEDLGVTCVLSNGLYFTGDVDPAGDADHLVYFGMEYRSAIFGHMGILGLSSLLPFGCCLPGYPASPTNHEIAVQAAAQGALVIAAHPVTMDPDQFDIDLLDWPYSGFAREVPVDLALGGIHAFDVYSYSNYSNDTARELWYELLNLGYRIPGTAGTDASVNRYYDPPIGGYRVYAKLSDGSPFTLDAWLEALRSGRVFSTNGPLLERAVLAGRLPGDTIPIPADRVTTLSGELVLHSREPLDYVDIVYNGTLLRRIGIPTAGPDYAVPYSVTVPGQDGWIAVYAVGLSPHPTTVGDRLELLVSPVYLRAGRDALVTDAARTKFLDWIERLETLVRARPDPDQIATNSALAVLERGRRQLTRKQVSVEDPREHLLDGSPNERPGLEPAGPTIGRDFVLLGRASRDSYLEVFDARGRLVHRESVPSLGDPVRWDGRGPGGRVSSGVYFARLVSGRTPSAAVRLVLLD